MDEWDESYQKIDSLEAFGELLTKRGRTLLEKVEPEYNQRFKTCEKLGLNANQTHNECDPLLTGNFDKFVSILEALYEVRYYWKRLTETARLLEANVPETLPQQMNEASWFIYNLDSYWHAFYGLEERVITFLTRFKRMYKSSSDEEAVILDTLIDSRKRVKTGTRKVRDPLAHFRSQGVQGWRNGRDWEARLVRNYAAVDFIEVYDKNYLQHKDFYLGYIRTWVPQYGELLSAIFARLCTFSLERLEL